MKTETILGVGALIVVIVFIVFAFPQGLKVKNKPEGAPPERIDGGVL